MPQTSPGTVTRRVEARLLLLPEACDVSLTTQLHYDASDPFAVTATFLFGDGVELDWVLARDLLAEGLHRQTGEGDVALGPSSEPGSTDVELTLSARHGHARVALPTATLAAFLQDSHQIVPPGTESEHLDLDTTIWRLLSA